MACPHEPTCPLFAHFRVDAALSVWRTFYCQADFERCERYRRSTEGKPVPANLLPDGQSLEGDGGTGH